MCVLFADDETIITMALGEALRDAGHEVVTASDAPSAVRMLHAHPGRFSVLITDYHMPGELNGADLVERMRLDYPDIPMVITTGRPDVVTSEWRAQFRVELLSKPYTPHELLAMVDRLRPNPPG